MKNLIVKMAPFGCVIGLLFACNDKKEGSAAVDKEQIKKEIQAKEDAFAEVFNSGVFKNIGYYADDATSFFQNTAPLVGKEAIIDFLRSDLDSNTNKISFKTNEIFPSNDGALVVEIGHFNVVDSANNPVNSGNYISVFEKRNGKYVVVRDMSASDGVLMKQ
ncbi:MAG TPA: nuclear transport factor 2 family protein [Cyclobacteriaceae bacterium]|jgi:ketosteroid isomerase-like protein|nr:nuclear transport factor 2 family protein [Cyclobacteriaceae bacterium]